MTLDNAFSSTEKMSTSRLCLRRIKMSDAEAVFAFKSDPKVTFSYGQDPHRSIDETKVWLQQRLNDPVKKDSIFWIIADKGNDTAIGECCLWNFDPGFHCAEIGYELSQEFWGAGLMAEALDEVISFGFLEMDLHRIEACPFEPNHRSQDLLLKMGFSLEGRLRERHLFHGRYLDQLYYGLLRQDWEGRKDLLPSRT
jgi:ribosomal-protein-alanine N-acetyltransferase